MSLFAEILTIKENRQATQARIKSHKQVAHDKAQAELQQRQASLKKFSEELPQKEAGLFAEVKDQKVKKTRITFMRQKVNKLRQQQRDMDQGVEQARKQTDQAAQELKQAIAELNLAMREVEKLKEAKKIFDKKALLQQERTQEKQLEEFHPLQSAF